jgi:hypothetical protein
MQLYTAISDSTWKFSLLLSNFVFALSNCNWNFYTVQDNVDDKDGKNEVSRAGKMGGVAELNYCKCFLNCTSCCSCSFHLSYTRGLRIEKPKGSNCCVPHRTVVA